MNNFNDDEILYGKRQSPQVMRDLDSLSAKVNDKIRARGIPKGFVSIWEDVNSILLDCEKLVYYASIEVNPQTRSQYLNNLLLKMRELSVDIRYLLKNRVLTPGEVGECSRIKKSITNQVYRWIKTSM